MRKAFFLFLSVAFFLSGCGSGKAGDVSEERVEKEPEEIEDVQITIPAGLVGNEIPDSITARVEEGSSDVVYSLSGEERENIVNRIAGDIEESIAAILSDKDYYPDIESIKPGSDYTTFTIELTEGRMNTYEAMLAMSFYTAGDKYQIYNGIPVDEAVTVVRYVDAKTGDVISEADSTSMVTK